MGDCAARAMSAQEFTVSLFLHPTRLRKNKLNDGMAAVLFKCFLLVVSTFPAFKPGIVHSPKNEKIKNVAGWNSEDETWRK